MTAPRPTVAIVYDLLILRALLEVELPGAEGDKIRELLCESCDRLMLQGAGINDGPPMTVDDFLSKLDAPAAVPAQVIRLADYRRASP